MITDCDVFSLGLIINTDLIYFKELHVYMITNHDMALL